MAEVASPPKRMTRARAAAGTTTGTAAKATTKPSSRTKSTATATATDTTTTSRISSMKRKNRTYEDDDDEEDDLSRDPDAPSQKHQPMMTQPPKTRQRVKKTADPVSEPRNDASVATSSSSSTTTTTTRSTATSSTAPKATRGRPKKTAVIEEEQPTEEPPKATSRLRTRKPAAEPVKKATRTRAKKPAGTITNSYLTEPTPGLKSAASRTVSGVRKTVTFQEPEKENVLPVVPPKATKAKPAESSATGMRARPVRKPAGAASRTTRATARATTTDDNKKEKIPLSPKKGSQNISLGRDTSSDDELAGYDMTPPKPLLKSPVKPPTGVSKIKLPAPEKDNDENSPQPTEQARTSVFSSPARRPPASPLKDTFKSPAKRVDAVPSLIFSAIKSDTQGSVQSPTKSSILQSPAKRPQLPLQAFQKEPQEQNGLARSPTKMSLLHTPAKRGVTPLKLPDSSIRVAADKPAQPNLRPVAEEVGSAQHSQSQLQTAADVDNHEEEANAIVVTPEPKECGDDIEPESPSQLSFPGRLSAVLPRHADPALKQNPLPLSTPSIDPSGAVSTVAAPHDEAQEIPAENDPMEVDEPETEELLASSPAATTPPQSAPKRARNPMCGLRSKDLNDHYVSESEDELAMSNRTQDKNRDDDTLTFVGVPATPTPAASKSYGEQLPSSAVRAANRAIRSISKGSKLGFTPLAVKLGEWKASSPLKLGATQQTPAQAANPEDEFSLLDEKAFPVMEGSPSKGYFEEEMRIRAELEAQEAMEAAMEAEIAARYDEPEFNDIAITNEDMELAAEANEMSLLETDETSQIHDDSISEASQEYGDENAVPIDPVLLGASTGEQSNKQAPVTPVRPLASRVFHTVSKVPLKPADDSPPRTKRHCASASKLSLSRPLGPGRNATVISYSLTKDHSQMDTERSSGAQALSSLGTPGRKTRADLNTTMLRGVVALVDVRTQEGGDAGKVFVDLLTSMGARCVKSWPWNPSASSDGELTASAVGITHVVHKDGGIRTLEKIKLSNGLVKGVGVSWVLDCEKDNEWKKEEGYELDYLKVPRGGHNRRKSMEPRAIANMNGTLVTPMKNNSVHPREPQTVPNNYMSRRESAVWVRTPPEHEYDEDEDAPGEYDWMHDDAMMLTPVPKTPAPETVARFAMDVTPGTPTMSSMDISPERDELMMRTCPPQKSNGGFANLGAGLLSYEKDQTVMMRLMAARRKSLQFAPKVASPLSKAWN
ncbi:hypothetical protein F5Y16DRAFT_373360 [Xylariaceae sp. FL0255]|nr:hypothetical protein F5Y16DRAFT_373360 [Xylariaceae sp. FL0255]